MDDELEASLYENSATSARHRLSIGDRGSEEFDGTVEGLTEMELPATQAQSADDIIAAAHERKEIGRVFRCESQTDCSVRLLYQ